MEYYTIGQFSKLVGKSIQTLRLWDKEDKLKPHHTSQGGHRYYSQQQVLQATKQPIPSRKRKTIGYCRAPSIKQKDSLELQVELVKTYMIAKGYSFDTITDVGSAIDFNKKGLVQLMNMVAEYEVDRIVVLYKDRLARFGYELIENLCSKHGTEIEVIDQTEVVNEQELVEDLIQILEEFNGILHGKPANKAKKLIKELLENDSGEK
ncbi:MAG: IS607 family transposase [Eubacteriaceae bacterium]|nr:IS607 family transposase [Eubacteriaceae bacterium]